MAQTALDNLEAEAIYIMREVVAECTRPIMLYSMGKDSTVLLHLAKKAFFPEALPFPLLHIDTGWKFREMYQFRDTIAQEEGLSLLVYQHPQGMSLTPFDHGAYYTDVTKTQALKHFLQQGQYTAAFGGARREEEAVRSKERIFSFRNSAQAWNPQGQRPEFWNLYNTKLQEGESIRVFPLSNWKELDIWNYIARENLPFVPLYLAKPRPVVERDGHLIMVDDERFLLTEGEETIERMVRFRSLGCYPLTGAIESTASTLTELIEETKLAQYSERKSRLIDKEGTGSMERRKREGYF